MSVRKKPLRLRELALLEAKAKEIYSKAKKRKDSEIKTNMIDTYKVFKLLRYTGMHVSVLSNPKGELHEEISDEGKIILAWQRPKKDDVWARTIMPKNDAIDFDVNEYGKELYSRKRQCSRQYFRDIIKNLGIEAGFPGISPQTLRHSIATTLLDGGVPDALVCDILNISRSTLKWYANYTDKGKTDWLEKIGWSIASKNEKNQEDDSDEEEG